MDEGTDGTPVIGYEPDFAPLTFGREGAAHGLAIDIVAEACRRADLAARFVPVALPDQDAALAGGRVAAIGFKAIIPERLDVMDFSRPMLDSGPAWFRPAAVSGESAAPADGERLATPARGPLVAQLRRAYPRAEVVAVGTYAAALDAVAGGAADVAALNFHIGRYLAARDHAGAFRLPAAAFQPMPVGIACARGRQPALLAAFDRALAEMLADGAVAAIERRWLGA